MKVCVYAICKNEIQFIERWLESLKDADYIAVMDTGSTDGTYEKFQELQKTQYPQLIIHQEIIEPWRFDTARNASMKYIPTDADICAVADLDQVWRPGWKNILIECFEQGYEEVYGDMMDYDMEGNEEKRLLSKNVHPNSSEWWWERPIHEGIHFHGNREPRGITRLDFFIEHHPDRTKSRDNYLKLLEIEYKENSSDPYCAIYYGCELSFHNKWQESYQVFKRATEECDCNNCPEVGTQIFINMALCCQEYGELEKAVEYILQTDKFNLQTRRRYMTQAKLLAAVGRFDEAITAVERALELPHQEAVGWIDDENWYHGECFAELAKIYDQLGLSELGAVAAIKALEQDSNSENNKNALDICLSSIVRKRSVYER